MISNRFLLNKKEETLGLKERIPFLVVPIFARQKPSIRGIFERYEHTNIVFKPVTPG